MNDDPIDRDALTDEIADALVEAHRAGQGQGVTALRNLRARLEAATPGSRNPQYRAGHADATQAARAEAATVLAQLLQASGEGRVK